MITFVTVLHVIVCLILILVILLQAGKGADMGATFGAGSSQSLFGARGAATFLSKMTAGAAMLFLLTSIVLANLNKNRAMNNNSKSVVEGVVPNPVPPPPPPQN